jgi:putative transcriptional regulator
MIKIHLSRVLGERRISQRQLAEMSGVRPNTINILYNEKIQRIDLDILNRICKALECQPGDLLEYISDGENAETP